PQARIMILISGLTLACALPQNAYSAVLAGLQRYDVIAGTNMLACGLRLLVILLLLRECGGGNGLILLAVAAGGTYLLGALLRTLAALRLCRQVQFRPWRVERAKLRPIIEFGMNSVIYMMSVHVGLQLAQIVVGAMMGTEKAADLNVAGTFLLAIHAFVVAFGISGRVVASRYDGENNDRMIRHLLLRSTRYSSFLTFAGVAALALFADGLFRVWVGRNYTGPGGEVALASVVQTCRLLLCGYGLFWLMLPAYNVVNGMGLHRFPAVVTLASALLSLSLVGVLATTREASIVRVAWGIVLPMVPVWGAVIPWYCCRQTRQPIGLFVWEGIVGPLVAVLPVGVIGLVWNELAPADAWAPLVFRVAVCGTLVLAIGWFFVLRSDDRRAMIASCLRTRDRMLGK
ncbi:MAG: oligosaccharide flippase family protein, partial [Planctomycetes bacterium]|nr:oligosaccharide flippase family protein [Planctomycetota bacterium]